MPADYKGARTLGLLRSEFCRAIADEDRALQLLMFAGLHAQPCFNLSCEVLGLKPSCWFLLGFSFYGNSTGFFKWQVRIFRYVTNLSETVNIFKLNRFLKFWMF